MPTQIIYFGPRPPYKPFILAFDVPDPPVPKKWNPQALKKAGFVIGRGFLPRLIPPLAAVLTGYELWQILTHPSATTPNLGRYYLSLSCNPGSPDRWKHTHDTSCAQIAFATNRLDNPIYTYRTYPPTSLIPGFAECKHANTSGGFHIWNHLRSYRLKPVPDPGSVPLPYIPVKFTGKTPLPIGVDVPYPQPQPDPNFGPAPWPFPEFWPPGDPMPEPAPSPSHDPWPWVDIPPLVHFEFEPSPVVRPNRPPRPRPRPRPSPRPNPGVSPQPGVQPGVTPGVEPVVGPTPTPAPSPSVPPVPVPVFYGGPAPNPSRPRPGTKEKKFRGTWLVAQMLDVLSETAEVVDCVYDALPSVAAKAKARKDWADQMQQFWKDYAAAAPKTAQEKAILLSKKPKWDPSWNDPLKKALKANKPFDRALPAQYEQDGAHLKLGYIYDHFGELDSNAMSEALKCAATNHYLDKVYGKLLPGGSNVRGALKKARR